MNKGKGWYNHPYKHSLASRGVETTPNIDRNKHHRKVSKKYVGENDKGNLFFTDVKTSLSIAGHNKNVREVFIKKDKDGDYWAYWDNEDEEFREIYDDELKVRTTDPNMFRLKEEREKGEVVKVSIVEKDDIQGDINHE